MASIFKSIAEEWQGFEATVLAKDALQIQRDEMRMAFFAGAWMVVCQTERMGEDDVSELEGMAQITALRDECREFQKEYIRRYSQKN